MGYHIAFARPTDLAAAEAGAAAGTNPRHAMALLARALDATVHDGRGLRPNAADVLLGKASGTPPLAWAIARGIRRTAARGDVVYCSGEDIGVAVGALCGGRMRVAVSVHNVDRPRARLAFRLFGLRRRVALFLSVAEPQIAFLRRRFGLGAERARMLYDQTDTDFFGPGPPSGGRVRRLVLSVGLEQRDYATLAAATAGLDLDVRISGFSRDAKARARAFPETMPANMDLRFYPWTELRQLYRDADVMVLSLFPSRYAAGVQVLMEALACGTPVIATRTEGLAAYLDVPGITVIAPGEPAALQAAIEAAVAAPDRSAARVAARRAVALERFAMERHVETVAGALRALN